MGKKSIILLIIMLCIFGFLIYDKQAVRGERQNSKIFSEANLRLSNNYINLTGSRICIYDGWDAIWPYNSYNYLVDPNNKTWAELALSEDWCSGAGTWNDPYIIENVYMDCQQAGTGISIFLSNAHFVIQNCYIHNAGSNEHDAGVCFIHVMNGQVKSNTFTYNHDSLWLWESSNNTLSDNIMLNDHSTSGFGKAIRMKSSNNNTILRNRSNNHYDGICIWDSNYNIITENFIENNLFGHYPDTGLYLVDSNYSQITFNTFAGDYANYANPYGDSIINQQNCVGNVVEDNFNEEANVSMVIDFQKTIKSSSSNSWFSLSNSNYNYIYGNRLYIEPDGQIIPGYEIYIVIGLIGIIIIINLSFNKSRKISRNSQAIFN